MNAPLTVPTIRTRSPLCGLMRLAVSMRIFSPVRSVSRPQLDAAIERAPGLSVARNHEVIVAERKPDLDSIRRDALCFQVTSCAFDSRPGQRLALFLGAWIVAEAIDRDSERRLAN